MFRTRTTDTQWRHKSKKSEILGQYGRQNMLQPCLKICDWDLIFGHAVKAISSPGVRSPLCYIIQMQATNSDNFLSNFLKNYARVLPIQFSLIWRINTNEILCIPYVTLPDPIFIYKSSSYINLTYICSTTFDTHFLRKKSILLSCKEPNSHTSVKKAWLFAWVMTCDY